MKRQSTSTARLAPARDGGGEPHLTVPRHRLPGLGERVRGAGQPAHRLDALAERLAGTKAFWTHDSSGVVASSARWIAGRLTATVVTGR
ncbi:hypothetical protein [Nonomuraea wenchangensis]|uniref:Uncharacterized protein n=1 Tax=Nonomuraea wenchangensis TaxID=568860 RepID=A0A1I0KIP2_9ACTN|nr:hypothetical protein [Nonomuraea wenchangensis]SEU24731.1 hypothetical protein SAMN05421811_108154 [Nonomuraea wenchangensis]